MELTGTPKSTVVLINWKDFLKNYKWEIYEWNEAKPKWGNALIKSFYDGEN